MKPDNYSDSMASEMLTRLASDENASLFRKDFVPQDQNAAADSKDSKDSSDSNDVKDSSGSSDDEDCSMADDSDEDDSDADDVSLALDTAVASLLSASAALDSCNFIKSAGLSLRLATFVAEAKKKSDSKKSKKDSKDSKSSKDSKDSKKSDKKDSKDSKKSDSKDSKDSKKSNPFAKKK